MIVSSLADCGSDNSDIRLSPGSWTRDAQTKEQRLNQMSQLNFTREEFEELKLRIDEVLDGKYEGLNFKDPSKIESIVFLLVEDNSEEFENLALVEKALAAGVTQAEIQLVRTFSEAGGSSFKKLIEDYIKFHKRYEAENAEDEETNEEYSA